MPSLRRSNQHFVASAARDFEAENDMLVTIVNTYKDIRRKIDVISKKFEDTIIAIEEEEKETEEDLTSRKLREKNKAENDIKKLTKKLYSENSKTIKSTSEQLIKDRITDEYDRLTINTNERLKVVFPPQQVIEATVNAPIIDRSMEDIYEDRNKKLDETIGLIMLGLVLSGSSNRGRTITERIGDSVIDGKTFRTPTSKLVTDRLGPINQRGKTKVISTKPMAGDIKGAASVSKSQLQKTKGRGTELGKTEVQQQTIEQLGKEVEFVSIWRTMQDNLVRDSHEFMEGQEKGELAPGGYISGDGNFTTAPRQFGLAEEDANCRCEEENLTVIN